MDRNIRIVVGKSYITKGGSITAPLIMKALDAPFSPSHNELHFFNEANQFYYHEDGTVASYPRPDAMNPNVSYDLEVYELFREYVPPIPKPKSEFGTKKEQVIFGLTHIDIIRKLVGPINPIGETNTDNERFEGLKEICNIVSDLINDITRVAEKADSYEHSVSRAGKYAQEFLDFINNKEIDG